MNFKQTFYLRFLIGISISVIKVDGLKCYECGDESPCNDFDLKKDTYAKDCNSSSNKGCERLITTGTDHRLILRCSKYSLNDCKTANGIEYCYCVTDLCNSSMRKLTGPTDDEDFIEGSGTTTDPSEAEKSVVRKDKSFGSRVDLYVSLIFIPFVIMFYNN